MSDIITELSNGVLRVALNRPDKKNALTSDMYVGLADILRQADKDHAVSVVLWHGAGDAFCAGNDIGDFLKAPEPGEPPQARLMNAFLAFEKPIVAAVQGAAIGGGTTMLTHCDVVYAGESARFKLPFIDLALVPEFGSSFSLPARIGHLRAAELFMLATLFTAAQAAELGLVTRVVPDRVLLATATETAQKLAASPPGALRAHKRLLKRAFTEQVKAAMAAENEEFIARQRAPEAKEAFAAFLEKRPPNFARATIRDAAE